MAVAFDLGVLEKEWGALACSWAGVIAQVEGSDGVEADSCMLDAKVRQDGVDGRRRCAYSGARDLLQLSLTWT